MAQAFSLNRPACLSTHLLMLSFLHRFPPNRSRVQVLMRLDELERIKPLGTLGHTADFLGVAISV
jgi:hypothetical protein